MLNFLGTGGAFNVDKGNTSAYFNIGSELFLIDSGEDVFTKVVKKDLFQSKTRVNIFITHLHSDHVGSLGTLIAYLYYYVYSGDASKVCVYFPSEAIKEYLSMQGVSEKWYTFYINIWDELYVDGVKKKLEYIFEETKHTDGLTYKGKNNCYSIEFHLKDEFDIYYSGDTCEFKEKLLNTYAYDAIYHEVTMVKGASVHTQYDRLMELTKDLPDDQKKKITLMHLDNGFDEEKAIQDGFSVASVSE